MAISARAAGTWGAVASASATNIAIPAGAASGDMMILLYALKPYTATPSMNQSWTSIGSATNGTTASGNGTGSVQVGAFYKQHTGSETNPTLTWGVTSDPGAYVIVVFQKGASDTWATPTGVGGGDVTSNTSFGAAMSSHMSATAGDMLLAVLGVCDDTVMTVPTFTQTGLTLDTVVEYPGTALSSTLNNDLSADACYRLVTAGTSSLAASVTGTLSTSETGTAYMVRLRVSGAATTGTGAGTATVPVGAASGGSTNSGTGAGSMPTHTGAATGGSTNSGSASGSMNPLVGASVGSIPIPITGTGAGTIAISTGSASGGSTNSGAGAATGNPVIGAASGQLRYTGTGSATGNALVGAGSGQLRYTGTGAGTLSALTGAASGALRYTGTAAGMLAAFVGSAAGQLRYTSTASATGSAMVGVASGGSTNSGTGAASLTPFNSSGVGGPVALDASGSATGFLVNLLSTASGQIEIRQLPIAMDVLSMRPRKRRRFGGGRPGIRPRS